MGQGFGELITTEELAVREVKLLQQCEEVIQADITAFMRVGAALATIKNERLYRSEFLSFPEYLAAKWDMGLAYADRLVDANKVVDTLKELLPGTSLLTPPIGGVLDEANTQPNLENFLPKNEAQARALTTFKDDPTKLLEVWTTALKSAPPGKLTAKHVEKTINTMDGIAKEEKKKQIRQRLSDDEKTKIQSPAFKETFDAFWAVLNEESKNKFATTSKEAFRQAARGILDVVGE